MGAFTDASAAIKAMWAANWPTAHAAIPVFWHENANPILPDAGSTPHWLHLAIEFDADELRAFGGGVLSHDRALSGSVLIRVFTATGAGEATTLALLDDAAAAFRGRRSNDGALSCIGVSIFPSPQARQDGAWWQRTALVSFTWRYIG